MAANPASTDRDGRTIDDSYDHLNRKIQENWLAFGSNPARTTTWTYDADGRLVQVVDPDSSSTYAYDNLSRVTSIDNAGTPGMPDTVQAMSYDADGNRSELTTTVSGAIASDDLYGYDALSRLTQVSDERAQVDLAYNGDGQLTDLLRYGSPTGSGAPLESAYSYDFDSRLTSLSDSMIGITLAGYSWDYNANGWVTDQADADGTTGYAYDNNGQLLSASLPSQFTSAYGYDANGNRTSTPVGTGAASTTIGADNRLLSDGTYDYTYDNEGNRLTRTDIATGDVTLYGWDDRNRLTTVTSQTSGGTITQKVTNTYDSSNRRIAQRVQTFGDTPTDTTERYVNDGANLTLTLDASGVVTHRFLDGPQANQTLADEDLTKSLRDPAELTWLLSDNQQSVRDVVDSQGNELDHLVYDAYGNVVSQSDATSAPRFQFTGMQTDAATGLNYDQARYYDPATGNFVSQDPKGFSAGDDNLFRYVGNDPVNRVDPSGLEAVTDPYQVDINHPLDLAALQRQAAAVQAHIHAQAAQQVADSNAALQTQSGANLRPPQHADSTVPAISAATQPAADDLAVNIPINSDSGYVAATNGSPPMPGIDAVDNTSGARTPFGECNIASGANPTSPSGVPSGAPAATAGVPIGAGAGTPAVAGSGGSIGVGAGGAVIVPGAGATGSIRFFVGLDNTNTFVVGITLSGMAGPGSGFIAGAGPLVSVQAGPNAPTTGTASTMGGAIFLPGVGAGSAIVNPATGSTTVAGSLSANAGAGGMVAPGGTATVAIPIETPNQILTNYVTNGANNDVVRDNPDGGPPNGWADDTDPNNYR